MRLLIVEDDAVIARDLHRTLTSFGHSIVGCVGTGEEAINLARRSTPDLVLIDVRLPGPLDGIAAAEEIRSQLQIAIVFVTAYTDDETVRRAAAIAPSGYVLKPFDDRILWTMLEIAASRHQLERTLYEREQALREANSMLAAAVVEHERRAHELTVLAEMSAALMRCRSLEDGYAVVARAAQRLFPDTGGTLYVQRNSPPAVKPVLIWGSESYYYPQLTHNDCCALREGQIFYTSDCQTERCRCSPIDSNIPRSMLCVPLMVEGETLGVLHIRLPTPEQLTPMAQATSTARRQLALALAEQAALGLANVGLRIELHEQAIRDPLTGLFNRRYLEENLAHEIHRAARGSYPIGVIMLDVDHFKQINDTYGHDAGDSVLRALGAQLLAMVRSGDLVCRYGGEEFVLLLPAAPLNVVGERAETIRNAINEMQILHGDQRLPSITISAGVTVVHNEHASVSAALARADAALYQAKRNGRNRIVSLYAEELPVTPEHSCP